MSKVHITLVGAQPAPVYNGIVATNPDIVVYIYSDRTINVVNKLREVVSVREDIQKPLDAIIPHKIMERILTLQQKYAEDEISLNISSGLKSWSHLFGREFEKMPNATVIYMDQNNTLWNYKTLQGTTDFNFDIYTLFRLYGNPIENHYTDLKDYSNQDYESYQRIEELFNKARKEFTLLLAITDKEKQSRLANDDSGIFKTETGSFVEWCKQPKENKSSVHIYLISKHNTSEITLESPHAIEIAFNSGWFEYKIARLINGWSRTRKVFLNCRFPFDDLKDKNEVDIIADVGNKVLFLECKTRVTNTTDIDKFNSVVRGYGGTGSKALFITEVPMSALAKQKCAQYEMMSFSMNEPHFGIDTAQALYFLLETEMFNINTK